MAKCSYCGLLFDEYRNSNNECECPECGVVYSMHTPKSRYHFSELLPNGKTKKTPFKTFIEKSHPDLFGGE